jgi:hypothetical protein
MAAGRGPLRVASGEVLLVVLALIAGTAAHQLARRLRPAPPSSGRGRHEPGAAAPAWRGWGLALAGLALLLAGTQVAGGGPALTPAVAGYAALAAFAAANRDRPGLMLVAVGLVANAAVTAVNGGMPVAGAAPGAELGPLHHGLSTADTLTWLADTMRIPFFRETVSPGDLLMAAGVAVAAFAGLGGAPTPDGPAGKRPAVGPPARP